jgi:hypothetical protein
LLLGESEKILTFLSSLRHRALLEFSVILRKKYFFVRGGFRDERHLRWNAAKLHGSSGCGANER